MENGVKILIVALYISPNQKRELDDIINFLHHSLLTYTRGNDSLLHNNKDEIPMILSRDFNVNFASDKSLKLVEFLKDKLNLSMKNSPQTSTTRSGTTIDGAFTRSLNSVECKKLDLYNLASELRVSVTLEDKIIDLREKITSCTFFQNNEQVVKEMLDNIVDERKSLEIEALKKIEREISALLIREHLSLKSLNYKRKILQLP
ncbi:ATP-dependent DNA helicase [Trichonephila clavipes]|nr:ATP-dependent DNA helicase [Trichonephila clavipes]